MGVMEVQGIVAVSSLSRGRERVGVRVFAKVLPLACSLIPNPSPAYGRRGHSPLLITPTGR